jgi:hypothetical protein
MFFTLTPVNLVEGEFGETSLINRGFSPVGILEPILWLMHMHGFSIFR